MFQKLSVLLSEPFSKHCFQSQETPPRQILIYQIDYITKPWFFQQNTKISLVLVDKSYFFFAKDYQNGTVMGVKKRKGA
jgi:hypothetical protein